MYIIIPTAQEEFKFITYHSVKKDSYEISNYGRIYSKITNKYLKSYIDSKGYMRVQLMKSDGKTSKNFKVHRLVAWEFCYDAYRYNRTEVNHKDSNRQNNYYENLEWSTSKENTNHAFKDGFRKPKTGEYHYANKYPDSMVRHIKSLLMNGYNVLDIMNYFGYKHSKDNLKLAGFISDVKHGRVRKDVEGSTTIENYYIYISV